MSHQLKAISTALIAWALACVMHAPIAEAQTETVLYSFCSEGVSGGCADGAYPYAGLINVGGVLYGTTYWGGAGYYYCDGGLSLACGTVFSFDPQAGVESVVYSLCSRKARAKKCIDGEGPQSGVIEVNGTLYGTTVYGGTSASSAGTVFAVDLTTDSETVLFSFPDKRRNKQGDYPVAGLIDVNGVLYGTTPTTAFSLDPTNDVLTVLHRFPSNQHDGRSPEAGMIQINDTLFGTTEYGGKYGSGTVFSLDPTTGAEAVVYSFGRHPTDGGAPLAVPLSLNGVLYGTTEYGGKYGAGTVFSLDPTTGVETVLYSFKGYPSDGVEPVSSLVNIGATLYGTTWEGGKGKCYTSGENYIGCGTVFALDPQTGAETLLYAFSEKHQDGNFPNAGLIDVNGTLYGTTEYGGTLDYGTVFSINPSIPRP